MENQIRVLFLEDREDDLLLLVNELKAGGFNLIYECASDNKAMEKILDERSPLCDRCIRWRRRH